MTNTPELSDEDKTNILQSMQSAITVEPFDISKHFTPQEREEAKAKLIRAREALTEKNPFLGSISSRLEIAEADWTGTLSTDGKRQYYSIFFVRDRSEHELMFGLANNALHIIYDHIGRRGDRHHRIWNCANDIIICDLLLKMGFEPLVEDTLIDSRFNSDTHTSEQVYDIIYPEYIRGEARYVKDGQEFIRKPEGEVMLKIDDLEFDLEDNRMSDEECKEKGYLTAEEAAQACAEMQKAADELRKDKAMRKSAPDPKIKG